MNNYKNDNTARRYIAHVSIFGTTQIHLRNPYIVAWWSASFPGFGHLLLSKYLRGFVLFIWEVLINLKSHVNLAMIYSFQGNIDIAKEVLNTRWLLIYIPVYIFAICDEYILLESKRKMWSPRLRSSVYICTSSFSFEMNLSYFVIWLITSFFDVASNFNSFDSNFNYTNHVYMKHIFTNE